MPTDTLTRPAATPSAAGRQSPPSNPPSRSGLVYLDLLRIGAILAVVVIHAVGTATRKSGTGWHSPAWWGADLLNSLCLWCVPVFVMVSGALLLDPTHPLNSRRFLQKRSSRIGVPLAFWIAVYLIFAHFFYAQSLSIGSVIASITSGDPFLQLYFLFIVAGLTAITPLLRKVVEHSERRELWWITGSALGLAVAELAFRQLGNGGGGFNATTRFLPYVGYYLAGYMLATARFPDRVKAAAPRVFITGWLATALGSAALAGRYGWVAQGNVLYDYLSPTVIVMSMAAFVWARGWQTRRISDATLRSYGAATFGIFLIHPLLLLPLMRSLGLPEGSDIGRTVAWALPLALFVCMICGAITLIVERIPGLRRVLG